jgi:hypothetical protein
VPENHPDAAIRRGYFAVPSFMKHWAWWGALQWVGSPDVFIAANFEDRKSLLTKRDLSSHRASRPQMQQVNQVNKSVKVDPTEPLLNFI